MDAFGYWDASGAFVAGLAALGVVLLYSASGRRPWTRARSAAVMTAGLCFASVPLALHLLPFRPAAPPGGGPLSGPVPLGLLFLTPSGERITVPELMEVCAKGGPALGEVVPDFTLPDVRTGQPVRLARACGDRPLVMVFGSWGCSVFRWRFPSILKLADDYQGRADFLFVQVMDPPNHPLPTPVEQAYRSAGVAEEAPPNRVERAALAAEAMGSTFRHLLDTPKGDACWIYKAFPARLFIISGGRVAYDSSPVVGGGQHGWRSERVRECLGCVDD